MKNIRIQQVKYLVISLLLPAVFIFFLIRTVSVQAASTIQSDDFNVCSLDENIWTFVDPVGDSTLVMSGTQAKITVPSGSYHDVWNSGVFAARLMQPANDTDFEVEVKFETAVNQGFQLQGIIIEEDNSNFLRFDFYFDGTNTHVFAASFVSSSPTVRGDISFMGSYEPAYLRVSRVGDLWTQYYSDDGLNWIQATSFSHSLQVNQVGPFAGNAGSNPEHTAIVDYFFNTAFPITPEDGLSVSHTLTLNTVGNGSITVEPDKSDYSCNETAVLTATASTGWTFSGWSGDLTGSSNPELLTIDDNKVVTATFTAIPTSSLTTNIVGNGIVTATPDQVGYLPNTVVTLTATANLGWEFTKWTIPSDWWDNNWGYRLPIQVTPNGYQRLDKPVELDLNFTQLLSSLGQSDPFDLNSLRVIEIDTNNQVIDFAVPYQFDQATGFDAATNASGTLIFLMSGTTAVGINRTYHLYFDVTGHPFTPASFTPQISLTENVIDEGQNSFQIDTNDASYFYHELAGGFSSLVDVDGNDWINFHPGGGSAGEFRGIPNLVYPDNYFHPGFTNVTSTIVYEGPIKATVQSTTTNGLWEVKWEFYPHYARMTVLSIDHNYWFLYEGTPGGTLDTATDIVVRSDGTQTTAGSGWIGDIVGEEWLYFGDPGIDRSLFIVNHTDDTIVDSYFALDGQMTVFGFGRDGISSFLNQAPAQFTIGLADSTAYSATAETVYSAYKDISVNAGTVESKTGNIITYDPTLTVTMTADKVVTATFSAVPTYTLTINTIGQGSVAIDPNQTSFLSGTAVTLTANPTTNWLFDGWSGDLTGSAFTDTLTMTADKVVTATFSAVPTYTLTINTIGQGSVAIDPNQTSFLSGTAVTLTASPDINWLFDGWSGDLTGSAFTDTLTMTVDKVVTATFSAVPTYTLTVSTIGSGNVAIDPNQTSFLSGTAVTLTASPDINWLFDGWSGDLTGSAFTETLTMNNDKIVTATFSAIPTYTLTINTIGQGNVNIDPSQVDFLDGTLVNLQAVADTNWTFASWSGSLISSAIAETIIMTRHQIITATFVQNPLFLTINIIGSGTVHTDPNQAAYLEGDLVTLTAIADTGWTFSGWDGALTGQTMSQTMTMNSDQVVTATFTAVPTYALTINTIGQGTVIANPNQDTYLEGTLITVTAVPEPGWEFFSWAGDLTGNSLEKTLTMTNDKVVMAIFTAIPTYTLTLHTVGNGSVITNPDQTNYLEGTPIDLIATADEGWIFAGWSGDETGNDPQLSLSMTKNINIIATFTYKYSIFLPFVTQ